MTITCPKCNHTANDTDEYGAPVTSCPKCGIIYAWYNPNGVRPDTKITKQPPAKSWWV
jgi:hypothetical protein